MVLLTLAIASKSCLFASIFYCAFSDIILGGLNLTLLGYLQQENQGPQISLSPYPCP